MSDKKAPKTEEKAPKVAEISAETAPVTEEKAPKKAEKAGTVKVEFLRSHPEYGYFPGDKAEISQEAFDRIQKGGEFFKKA